MAISLAVQRGNTVYVYNEKKHQCAAYSGTELAGYTNSTVSVKRGNHIYTYDEKGRNVGAPQPVK